MVDKKSDNQQNKDSTNEENRPETEDMLSDEILEAIPEEDRGKVASIIKQTMISGVMRRNNPVAEKITSEHITQLITKSDSQDVRDRKERKGERNYNLVLILVALAFIAFLIIFLQAKEDLLIKIVIGIIAFIGGYGFGQSKKVKTD